MEEWDEGRYWERDRSVIVNGVKRARRRMRMRISEISTQLRHCSFLPRRGMEERTDIVASEVSGRRAGGGRRGRLEMKSMMRSAMRKNSCKLELSD